MPVGERLAEVDASVGAGLGKPGILWHVIGSECVAGRHFFEPVGVVTTACGVEVEQSAGDAIDGHLVAVDHAFEAAFSAAVA